MTTPTCEIHTTRRGAPQLITLGDGWLDRAEIDTSGFLASVTVSAALLAMPGVTEFSHINALNIRYEITKIEPQGDDLKIWLYATDGK